MAPSGEAGNFCRQSFDDVLKSGLEMGDVAGQIERFFWEFF